MLKILQKMAVLLLALNNQGAFAQNYPTRPVRLIVPFTAGAATDNIGRLIGENLARRLGQPVIVENRAGAGSQIGIDHVAKAMPDGYTLLFATNDGMAVLPAVKPKIPYSVTRDFIPLARIATTPLALAVKSSLSVKSMPELIAYAKANPGALRYGSVGEGSFGHMTHVLLESLTGTKMTHIPYKGMAPVVNDLLAGHIDLALVTPPTLAVHASSDRIHILTVTGKTRHIALPNVPSATEVGLPDFDVDGWFGVFAPAGMPRPIVDRLTAELEGIMRDPAVLAQLQQKNIVSALLSGNAFAQLVARDLQRWKSLAGSARISLDD